DRRSLSLRLRSLRRRGRRGKVPTRRTPMADVLIYDALRTPRGRGKAGKGGLSHLHPQELFAQTINQLAARLGLDKNLVEDMAVGCVSQGKGPSACIARNAT